MRSLPDIRIVFMGTPDFAVASLKALVEAGANIVGVVTAPDKPAGRGMQLQQSPVKQFALSHGLHVLQPPKLKAQEFIDELRVLHADLQIVVAFRMLPEIVWNMPPMGTINVHGSLLPQYRGAAPINWAVINGEKETGVTTFQLVHEIDKGSMLLQEKLSIGPDENAGSVHDRMMEAGAKLLVRTVEGILRSEIAPKQQQDDPHLKHAPKIFTETAAIDWNQPIEKIHNLIRGLSPFPGAFTQLEGKTLKIYSSKKDDEHPKIKPGGFETDGKTFLRFAAADGYIRVLELQLEGKRKMQVSDFLRGYRFQPAQ